MTASFNSVDLRLLRVFARVVECGGFAAAQVDLNISQSTISTQIAELESRLGTRLCQRGRSGFRLTDNGQKIFELTQRLFKAIREFSTESAAVKGTLSGDLHIGVIDNLITNPDFCLHQAISKFKDRREAVHLHLHVASPLELERGVLEESYHVGIGTFPNRAPGLIYRHLLTEEQNLYCGREHPLFPKARKEVSPNDLKAAEYVERGYINAHYYTKFKPRNIAATAFNMEAIALMILSGKFIGHLPTHYAESWVKKSQMRALSPSYFKFSSQFDIIVRKGVPKNSAAIAFLGDLMSIFKTTTLSTVN